MTIILSPFKERHKLVTIFLLLRIILYCDKKIRNNMAIFFVVNPRIVNTENIRDVNIFWIATRHVMHE